MFLFPVLGDSNDHNHTDMPFILAGRAGGALTTGRHLNFAADAHTRLADAQTRLLVSIANLMGVNINTFGYTGHGKGDSAVYKKPGAVE